MTARLAHIVRHPIKSVGYEAIGAADLTAGQPLPFDRVWAIAHEAAVFADAPTEWVHKRNFVRGVAAPALMAVRAETDAATGRVTLRHPRAEAAVFDLAEAADRTGLIDWLRPFWPANRPAPRGVVQLPGAALADTPEPFVAILGLGSLAALSDRAGRPMSMHRFRGNLWVDGWAPFAEFDLVGRRIRVGGALVEVAERITRCRATCANPETGVEDVETLDLLEAGWGHQDFGVYGRVVEGGAIRAGDPVEVLP